MEDLAQKMGLRVKLKKSDYYKSSENNIDETEMKPPTFNTEKAISALKKLSSMNVFKDIEDPVEWQRQVRKDRKLFG